MAKKKPKLTFGTLKGRAPRYCHAAHEFHCPSRSGLLHGRQLRRGIQNYAGTAQMTLKRLEEAARGDLVCSCDGARIRQVLSNLLGNALQHGAEGGVVELSMTSRESEIKLAVRNQGPPISPDVLPTIFDPLVRDTSGHESRERRVGSIGLGLYIAREIVASHGGTIDVVSHDETGTVFTVRIPRCHAEDCIS